MNTNTAMEDHMTQLTNISLPRAETPEAAGISSGVLAALMREIIDEDLELHSVMVLRRGLVAYENFRSPYGPDDPHAMFSVSKSITSIAVGLAVEEGLLRLEDKVADIVPELRKYDKDPRLEQLQVVHLVSLCAGKNVSGTVDKTKKQWVRDYAEAAWDYAPGEGWHYCNENMYMLCVILHRVCGQSVVDYLMPRLFEPLGIERPYWEHDGLGVEAGGWGIYLKTEDLAKIAQCYLDDGVFRGRQLIPAEWVQASSSLQRDNSHHTVDGIQGQYGYGYGFWINTPPGGYRIDGMFSQYALNFPEYDACVITTGGDIDHQKVYQTIIRHLPALFEEGESAEIPGLPAYPPLPAAPRNTALESRLNSRCVRFLQTLQPIAKAVGFPLSVMPLMVLFMSYDQAGGIDRVHLRFEEDILKFSWSEGSQRNTVLCGMDGQNRKCKVTLGGEDFVLACSAAWEGDQLKIWLRNISSVAARELTFEFRGRAVRLVPRCDPGLDSMVDAFVGIAKTFVANKTLGNLIAGLAGPLLHVVEFTHIGYVKG